MKVDWTTVITTVVAGVAVWALTEFVLPQYFNPDPEQNS